MPGGMGLDRGMFGEGYRSNSPALAYKAVYKKDPKAFIPGMSFSKKKDWNGIPVDAGLKNKWLNSINSIKNIEIRSTEEGKGSVRVPHVAFRMRSVKYDKYVKSIVRELNGKPGIHAISDIGAQGRPRIMVAGKAWKSKDIKKWNEWWNSVAEKIGSSVSSGMGHRKKASGLSEIMDRI